MTRLPAIKRLAADVESAKVGKRQRVADSVAFLARQVGGLRAYTDVEDLAEAAFDESAPNKAARALVYHLEKIRGELARQLWRREIFVGVTVIDELLFSHASVGASDPVLATLQTIRDSQLNRPGMVVFPLHSFGVLAAGLLRPFRGTSTVLINPAARYAIAPQTNNLGRTVTFLNDVAPQLGVKKPIEDDLIEHWRRSRGARWLESNPLLVAGMTSISGYYYENEFLVLGRLRAITSAVVMLAALQPANINRAASVFSSSRINNWETRDIHHYLVLSDTHAKALNGRAIPIHQRRQVGELSDMAVDIDPRFWQRRKAEADAVHQAVDALYAGYLSHSVGRGTENTLGSTYRKLFEAVTYFRRSCQGDSESWTAVVSLATAFEMLLTDSYEPGIALRLRRRTQALLRGVPRTRTYQAAVEDLYYARSATVHSGEVPGIDLSIARQAFVLVFRALITRMPTLNPRQPEPMAFLTGVR